MRSRDVNERMQRQKNSNFIRNEIRTLFYKKDLTEEKV